MTVSGDHLCVAVIVLRLRIRCVLGMGGRVGSYRPGRRLSVAIMSGSYVLRGQQVCQHHTKALENEFDTSWNIVVNESV